MDSETQQGFLALRFAANTKRGIMESVMELPLSKTKISTVTHNYSQASTCRRRADVLASGKSEHAGGNLLFSASGTREGVIMAKVCTMAWVHGVVGVGFRCDTAWKAAAGADRLCAKFGVVAASSAHLRGSGAGGKTDRLT